MTPEISALAWGCVLGIVHIFIAVRFKTRQYGTKWNMGARDEALPPPQPVAGRLARAQANFFETFPIFAAAALALAVTGLSDELSRGGAWMWLAGRIAYLPLYAFGVPVVRTIAFGLSLVGLLLVLRPLLAASFA